MALIEAEDLVKTYVMGDQTVHALRGVSLTVEAGEFVAIMGASGSGKSTLMNILGCLDQPTSGHYRLAGEEVAMSSDELASDRATGRIGFVFQQFNLLPRTSALENVELPMVYAGPARRAPPRAGEPRAASAWRAALTTPGRAVRRAAAARRDRARAGQRQPLILADEPTGALDSADQPRSCACSTELNRQGMTVLLSPTRPTIAAWTRRRLVFQDRAIVVGRSASSPRAGVARDER